MVDWQPRLTIRNELLTFAKVYDAARTFGTGYGPANFFSSPGQMWDDPDSLFEWSGKSYHLTPREIFETFSAGNDQIWKFPGGHVLLHFVHQPQRLSKIGYQNGKLHKPSIHFLMALKKWGRPTEKAIWRNSQNHRYTTRSQFLRELACQIRWQISFSRYPQ